uniref:C2H2-type domain-containing protein n=1 Tax=Scylla olivacea TaxID=85551 RepID=A0A0P4WJL2_SCYOL
MWARLSCPPARPPHKPWFSPLLLPLAPRTPCPVRPSASPSASPGAGKPASPDSTSCHGHSLGSSSPQEARSAFRRVGASDGTVKRTTLVSQHAGPSRHTHTPHTPTVNPLLLPQTPDNSLFLHPRLLLGALIPSHSPHTTSHPIMPTMPLAGAARPLLASGSVAAVDPCAEMETLVSNLGRSRRGHLCLYCGKVYSRKYGLKIHIRTHTGYKPLKCRVCLRPFGDPSNLNKHVRLHAQGETPYRCDHCGKVLVRRRDLDRHVRSRHPQAVPPTRPLTDTETETDTEDEEEVVEVEMEGEGLRHGENLQEPSTVTQ